MRVVSLFLPDWPIDRLRRAQDAAPEANSGEISLDAPLVLVQRIGNRQLIYAANAAARAGGLRPGMTVAHPRWTFQAENGPAAFNREAPESGRIRRLGSSEPKQFDDIVGQTGDSCCTCQGPGGTGYGSNLQRFSS